jgi:hypothetical protein
MIVVEEKYQQALDAYIEKLEEAHKDRKGTTFSYKRGKRFDKIIITDQWNTMVHCFVVHANGDILKSATWHQPVKDPRGNIYFENVPLKIGDYYKENTHKYFPQ